MCISLVAMRRSISFAMQDVRLMGRKEDFSEAGFLGFGRGIIVAYAKLGADTFVPRAVEEVKEFASGDRAECLMCVPKLHLSLFLVLI